MSSSVACTLLLGSLPILASSALPHGGDGRPIAAVPFDVRAPGAYFLTGDIAPCGAPYGIRVLADDVIIDLGGFVLEGGPASGPGIFAEGERRDIVVRNGRVAHWGGDGIALSAVEDVELREVSLYDNGGHGAHLGDRSRITACTSDLNHGGRGILTGAGATIAGCTARGNEYGGIFTGAGSTLLECRAEENLYGSGLEAGPEAVLRGCEVEGNRESGIRVGAGSLVTGCSARANLSVGIEVGGETIVRACRVSETVDGNGISIGPGGWVEDCEVRDNRRRGLDLFADAIARGCTVSGNGQAGVRARRGCRLIKNTSESNRGAGIELIGPGVTVDGNVLGSNAADDLVAPGSGHFVVRNTLDEERAVVGQGSFVAPFRAREDPERGPWDNLRP
ncbi:MAG: hypothetical protein CMJ84_11020 [Planctomycetes bacterium]|jgi:hypothetical protein|nr:hypothetical protein [Planctomycetota bacterium]MDP6409205.1 right-handed parallel beta-helix repeat-containing protein [Planctomycetota bacterium]